MNALDNVLRIDVPKDITREQVGQACRILGIGHLFYGDNHYLNLRTLRIDLDGMHVEILTTGGRANFTIPFRTVEITDPEAIARLATVFDFEGKL